MEMARRHKGPAIAEDLSDVTLSYPCPHCGEPFKVLGARFQKIDEFRCGACAAYVPLPHEEKLRVLSKEVKLRQELMERLRAQITKKPG
jgi:DNA-directed RNA polymerase subunit RPC12/RpoP